METMTLKEEPTFLGEQHDCYYATDPRVNKELAASLKGKNVLVTGAGRGMGRQIAIFLTHASAKSVTVVALEQEEIDGTIRLCKEINPEVKTKSVALDVTDVEKVRKLVEEVEEEFGGVDVLVCNAGRPPQWLSTVESDPKIWWDTVSSSLHGAFLFTRFCLPGMQKRKSGCVIYTSSAGAHSNFGMGSYTMAKLGLVRLAEIIHNENFKEFNITSFAYHPGRVRTRFFTDFEDAVKGKQVPKGGYVADGIPHEDKSARTAYEALNKPNWDTPELAAGLVTALASGKLDFMSGRYVDASVDIEEYIKDKEAIKEQDLHRIRLHAAPNLFVPSLDF